MIKILFVFTWNQLTRFLGSELIKIVCSSFQRTFPSILKSRSGKFSSQSMVKYTKINCKRKNSVKLKFSINKNLFFREINLRQGSECSWPILHTPSLELFAEIVDGWDKADFTKIKLMLLQKNNRISISRGKNWQNFLNFAGNQCTCVDVWPVLAKLSSMKKPTPRQNTMIR